MSTAFAIAPRRKWPSPGFVAICASYLVMGAFLLWGLSTPPLDRIWTLHHELKIGERGALRRDDLVRVREALVRHPHLGRALLPEGTIGLLSAHHDGWLDTPQATVLRLARAEARLLRIEVDTPLDLLPFAIEVEGRDFDEQLTAREHGVLEVRLPAAGANAELFVVRLKGRKLRADPSVLNVRLTFGDGASS